ncbi:MAG: hypothetical protein R2839_04690 [Thermomicrobiales bacterium]
MPLTGEGPTAITAYDETGNVATASFYTEFGFDSLQESLESINAQLSITPAADAAEAEPASPAPDADGTPEAGS